MFGLVALLVTVGVIVVVFTVTQIPVAKRGKTAMDDASRIAGREGRDDPTPAADAVKTDPESKGGRFRGLKVVSVTPGSVMDNQYGLLPGDVILQAGDMDFSFNLDDGTARALFEESYQRRWNLVVLRNGQKITLSGDPTSPTGPAAASAAVAPPAPPAGTAVTPASAAGQQTATPSEQPTAAPPSRQPRRNIQDQVEAIRQGLEGGGAGAADPEE
jgi:hypothetical protein